MAAVFGQLPFNEAEEKVVVALKRQLPPEWLLIPSVRWAVRNDARKVRDREADIVVLAPGLGMLVIEVKGSREIRVTERGWQRLENGAWVLLGRSPIEQATSAAYELKKLLCDSLGWKDSFPGLFGWLVVYPNGEANTVPALFDHTTLATRRHMETLLAKVRDALEARGSSGIAQQYSAGAHEAVAKVLTSSEFRIVPADGADEVSDDKGMIDRLTRQQFAALRGLFELPSVAVSGPAGSGKTVLAIWRLQSLVESGKRAIYICYNRPLSEALRLRHPDLAPHIHSVDQLFGQTCPGGKPYGSLDDFHRNELPNLVFDVVTGWEDSRRYDAVLVDEAQDLSESQMLALHAFRAADGFWAVFLDRRQDIYRRQTEEALGADVLFRLAHNCRNTVRINAATNAYVGSEIDSMPGMPEGVHVMAERVSRQHVANRAFQMAAEWNRRASNSVAILSPYKIENSAMAGHASGHGLTLTTDLKNLSSAKSVYFSTIKSFKGIEADCIILVDAHLPQHGNPAFSLEDLYVACTRARTRLAVLSPDEAVVAYFKKASDEG